MKVGYGLITTFHAHAGQQKELAEILLEGAGVMEDIPACLEYIVGTSEQDEDTVFVVEVWTDEGRHRASLDNPAVKAVIERGAPLIREVERNKELDLLGGKGL
ncbi:putative quinol monooxygenase [Listeria kieliensis]